MVQLRPNKGCRSCHVPSWLLFVSSCTARISGHASGAMDRFQWQWSPPAAPEFRIFSARCRQESSIWYTFGGMNPDSQTCMRDMWAFSLNQTTGNHWSQLRSDGDVPEFVVGMYSHLTVPAFAANIQSMAPADISQEGAWCTLHGQTVSVLNTDA